MSPKGNFRREKKEFFEKVAQVDRVTRVVKGGRRFRFRAAVVIGDRKGRVGFGVNKGSDVAEAVKYAAKKAKKSLVRIPLTNFSIPHQVEGKFKGSRVLLKPAPEGRGIIAGGGVRIVVDLLGVKNVLAKILGSTNKLNSIQATLIALGTLRSKEDVFKMRGKEKFSRTIGPSRATESAMRDRSAGKKVEKKVSKKNKEPEAKPEEKPQAEMKTGGKSPVKGGSARFMQQARQASGEKKEQKK
ncbi:30S ribosomal protein S5 [Patescibacteria group bacterium]|nr:MAG: 30S ribosomal protein S5 [Patescibacteria group bacterium]